MQRYKERTCGNISSRVLLRTLQDTDSLIHLFLFPYLASRPFLSSQHIKEKDFLLSATMSKLNIGASEFVPGRFKLPQNFAPAPAPDGPPPQPIERPPQTEAPAPPPTITLNIGQPKPAPPAAAPAPAPSVPAPPPPPAPTATAPKPASQTSSAPKPSATVSQEASKSFTLERSKKDASLIAQDVRTVADNETLKDLYGDGTSFKI